MAAPNTLLGVRNVCERRSANKSIKGARCLSRVSLWTYSSSPSP